MSSLDITHHERERDPAKRAWDDHNPPSLDLIRDCVHCGFCLPTCPELRDLGEEMDSPRGRILLMRVGHEEGASSRPRCVTHFDRCLGCMACVTACPSGVQYDRLIETPAPQLERQARPQPRAARRCAAASSSSSPTRGRLRALAPLLALERPAAAARPLARACSPASRAAARCCALAPGASLPATRPPRCPRCTQAAGRAARPRRAACRAACSGCSSPTSTRRPSRVLARRGLRGPRAARSRAAAARCSCTPAPRTEALRAAPGRRSRPSRATTRDHANAAGCGSAMKDYGLSRRASPSGPSGPRRFAAQVARRPRAARRARAARRRAPRSPLEVAYHDACHLAHAQGVRAAAARPAARDPRRSSSSSPPSGSCAAARPASTTSSSRTAAAELGRAQGAQPAGDRRRARRRRPTPAARLQIAAHLRAPAASPGRAPVRAARPRLSRSARRWGAAVSVTTARRSATAPRPEILSPAARRASSPTCTGASSRRRRELLAARRERHARAARAAGRSTSCPRRGRSARATGSVAPPPADYADRRVEITGPTDRKLVINALNSGARGFMADFEDANSPDLAQHGRRPAQPDRRDRAARSRYDASSTAATTRSDDETATLLVRPRGWHLDEQPPARRRRAVSGALVDFGLYVFHNARRLLDRGSGAVPLPAQARAPPRGARCGTTSSSAPRTRSASTAGSIRATVLIETLPAAFQMEEILYELREHSAGLNAGRWDYIFSMIKCFRDRPEFVLPDRDDVKMTVPFMRAYTELLVRTCHRRGAYAMGGMAALIPSRQGPGGRTSGRSTASAADKEREAGDGFDGTWVAHPDIVRRRARGVRRRARRPPQPDRPPARRRRRRGRPTSSTSAATPGAITEAGLRNDVSVGLPVHLVLARRPRRGRHQQPHGGRRHGRDLALAALAVDPPRRDARRTARRSRASSCARSSTRRWRGSTPTSATRLGGRAAGGHARGLRARRAGRGLPRVPDAGRLRQDRLSRAPAKDGVATPWAHRRPIRISHFRGRRDQCTDDRHFALPTGASLGRTRSASTGAGRAVQPPSRRCPQRCGAR